MEEQKREVEERLKEKGGGTEGKRDLKNIQVLCEESK